MSAVASPVTGKPYGLAMVCRAWRIARSGIYRHRTPPSSTPPRRRGPTGALSDAALTAAIQAVLAASPFHGEGHRKVWARLRHAGTRTSLRRVLRLMRENDLLAPGRVGSPRGPRSHDGTIRSGNDRHHVGHRSDDHVHGRRAGGGLHRGGSLFRRVRRHSRPCASHTLPGAGTDPPGRRQRRAKGDASSARPRDI
jgi:hypothetical protein